MPLSILIVICNSTLGSPNSNCSPITKLIGALKSLQRIKSKLVLSSLAAYSVITAVAPDVIPRMILPGVMSRLVSLP